MIFVVNRPKGGWLASLKNRKNRKAKDGMIEINAESMASEPVEIVGSELQPIETDPVAETTEANTALVLVEGTKLETSESDLAELRRMLTGLPSWLREILRNLPSWAMVLAVLEDFNWHPEYKQLQSVLNVPEADVFDATQEWHRWIEEGIVPNPHIHEAIEPIKTRKIDRSEFERTVLS